jgi:hypothetical protein
MVFLFLFFGTLAAADSQGKYPLGGVWAMTQAPVAGLVKQPGSNKNT